MIISLLLQDMSIKKIFNKCVEIELDLARSLLESYLKPLNFTPQELSSFVNNVLMAEMADRPSHGFARAIWVKQNLLEKKKYSFNDKSDIDISISGNLVFVDAKKRLGTYAFVEAMSSSFELMGSRNSLIGLIANIGPYSGFVGAYAYEAINRGYVFLAMVDSPEGVVPYESTSELWGTNTITFGFPDKINPVLVDLTFAEQTLGDRYLSELMEGEHAHDAILPIAGHKGSSLIFMTKILAGMMSRSNDLVLGERTAGIFYLLIHKDSLPSKKYSASMLREILSQLHNSSQDKARFPGSRTLKNINESFLSGKITILSPIYERIKQGINE